MTNHDSMIDFVPELLDYSLHLSYSSSFATVYTRYNTDTNKNIGGFINYESWQEVK